jgi:predicted small metal-binding protein
MLSVYCKEVEPDLNIDHKVKGLDLDDLKQNMRSHLRETHPETEIEDEEMYAIDHRIQGLAEEDIVPQN